MWAVSCFQSLARTSSDLEMSTTSKGRDDIKRSRLTGISITRRSSAHAGQQITNWKSLLLKNIGKRSIKNLCHQCGMNSTEIPMRWHLIIRSHWFSTRVSVQKTDQLGRIQPLPFWVLQKRNMLSPGTPLYFHLHPFVSISFVFIYRPNAGKSDVLISMERYIHLHEEHSDDNKLSSAPWLTYYDSFSIQQNRTQRISHRPRYIIMR